MHELSLVMQIIDIAAEQAAKAGATHIESIVLEIGCLSTIEINAFDFAWEQAVKQTILEKTVKKVLRIKGSAICQHCNTQFELENYYDACPLCGQHHFDIITGKELKLKSLVVT